MLNTDTRGVWMLGTDPQAALTLARSGFDWIAFDLQHGRIDDARVFDLLASTAHTVPRWVRVRALDAGLIGRALDAGADGVIVPQVQSADEARAAVRAAHHPPRGARSWGPLTGYDGTAAEPRVAVMIETAHGLEEAVAIAGTDGVDLVLVGPFDLSLSLGTTVDALLTDAEERADAPLIQIRDAAEGAGTRVGAFAGDPEAGARFRALGYLDLAIATDQFLLRDAAERVLAGLDER